MKSKHGSVLPSRLRQLTRQVRDALHAYSREFDDCKFVHVSIAAVSAVLAFLINSALFSLDWRIVGSVSFFALFAIFEFLYARWIWRLSLRFRMFRVRDFSGEWVGQLEVGSGDSKYPAKLTIRQDWRKIIVGFDGADAEGKSFGASIFFDRLGDERLELAYLYYARSKNLAARHYFDHYGTAILYYDEKEDCLVGEYFTEKSRNSFGRMRLLRVHSE